MNNAEQEVMPIKGPTSDLLLCLSSGLTCDLLKIKETVSSAKTPKESWPSERTQIADPARFMRHESPDRNLHPAIQINGWRRPYRVAPE